MTSVTLIIEALFDIRTESTNRGDLDGEEDDDSRRDEEEDP